MHPSTWLNNLIGIPYASDHAYHLPSLLSLCPRLSLFKLNVSAGVPRQRLSSRGCPSSTLSSSYWWLTLLYSDALSL